MTIQTAIESFILDQRLKGNTAKTVKTYMSVLSLFQNWLAAQSIININELELHHVNKYQLHIDSKPADRGGNQTLTKTTVQSYMRQIKVFLKYCYHERYIDAPLNEKIKLPKAESPAIEILTDSELEIILQTFTNAELGTRNRAFICLLLDSGLRLSEAITLKTEDINFEKGYIKIKGKGRKERIVPVGLKVRKLFYKYISKRRAADADTDDKFFFLTKQRKPLTISSISTLMQRLKNKTGIVRLHAHLFRHTFATNFLVHGLGDIYELSRILGHSELKTTEIYLKMASFYTIIERKKRLSYLDMEK